MTDPNGAPEVRLSEAVWSSLDDEAKVVSRLRDIFHVAAGQGSHHGREAGRHEAHLLCIEAAGRIESMRTAINDLESLAFTHTEDEPLVAWKDIAERHCPPGWRPVAWTRDNSDGSTSYFESRDGGLPVATAAQEERGHGG